MRTRVTVIGSIWLAVMPLASKALDLVPGRYAIMLQSQDGVTLDVGTLELAGSEQGQMSYEIDWDDSQFSDQFLSMRPFKCLDGARTQWCRVPYPYANKRELSADDLTDLEYDLLFIWKKQGEYGINMWNGVYYDLERSESGLRGVMNDMDMDILSAPPEEGNLRPVGAYDLELADPDSHWLPHVSIVLR